MGIILIFLIPLFLIIYLIFERILIKKNKNTTKIGLSKLILFINIVVICFMCFGLRIITQTSSYIALVALIIINIICIVLLYNKNIISSRKKVALIMIIYFVLMFAIPIYTHENHEHIFIQEHEQIREYTEYYNCYLIKLFRIYK